MRSKFGTGLDVLVVDDEPAICELLGTVLQDVGFNVVVASTVKSARTARAQHAFDLIVTDKNLPDGTGLEFAGEIVAGDNDCEVVLITAYASVTSVIEAMHLGVADCIEKPFDLQFALTRFERVVDTLALKRRNQSLVEQLQGKND